MKNLLLSLFFLTLCIRSVGLSLVVEPQPSGNLAYVTNEEGKATLYKPVYVPGSTAILMHNTLGGDVLEDVQIGDEIRMGGGESILVYEVTNIYRFRATDPYSPYSAMVDLNTGKVYSVEEAYRLVYLKDILTIQTCISRDGNDSWGRLFIQAELIGEYFGQRTRAVEL